MSFHCIFVQHCIVSSLYITVGAKDWLEATKIKNDYLVISTELIM